PIAGANLFQEKGTGAVSIGVFDARTGKLVRTILGHDNYRTEGTAQVAVSPDGRLLASRPLTACGPIRIWDLTSGKLLKELHDKKLGCLGSMAFSPDGHYLSAGYSSQVAGGLGRDDGPVGKKCNVALWEVATGLAWHTEAHSCAVWSLAFAPD